jgi:hypothetical protein
VGFVRATLAPSFGMFSAQLLEALQRVIDIALHDRRREHLDLHVKMRCT